MLNNNISNVNFNKSNENTSIGSGITLKYESIKKDGTITTLYHTFGKFVPKSNSQDDVFKSWKELIALYWGIKTDEQILKQYNGGIASKLRSSVPVAIIFKGADFETEINIKESVWRSIGLTPTKKDVERLNGLNSNDYKKALHKATLASFATLGFRDLFNKEIDKPQQVTA